LLGSSSYRVKVTEEALYLGGKLSQHAALSQECGCPAPAPVLRAAEDVPANDSAPSEQAPSEVTSPLPPDKPGQVHVEVDAPFVFNARAAGARPYTVAKIKFSSLPNVAFAQETVDPAVLPESAAVVSPKQARQEPKPAPQNKESTEKKGFLTRVKGFFGGIFHR